MTTFSTVLYSLRSPNLAFRRVLSTRVEEPRAFAWLVSACLLFFLARLPLLSREAHLNPEMPQLESIIGGVLIGSLFIAPLVLYSIAALSCLFLRVKFKMLNWMDSRVAFFWSLLAVTPLVLLRGILGGFLESNLILNLASILIFFYFLYVWASCTSIITKVINVK